VDSKRTVIWRIPASSYMHRYLSLANERNVVIWMVVCGILLSLHKTIQFAHEHLYGWMLPDLRPG
jgi:hypothetical protein